MTMRIVLPLLALFVATAALAQNAQSQRLRGVITVISADGARLDVKARTGEARTARLKPDATVTLVVPSAMDQVKPGAFIGVAALPDANGELKAMEVHIFPESMRGMGEGSRSFDLAPGSSMTNGAVAARVDSLNGQTLTVTYRGGEQAIRLEPGTPVVALASGARSDLAPGAAIIAFGALAPDGAIEVARVLVGKDGLTPPM